MLTEARSLVLSAMLGYAKKHSRAPTLEELCELTGTSSVGRMHHRSRLALFLPDTKPQSGKVKAWHLRRLLEPSIPPSPLS